MSRAGKSARQILRRPKGVARWETIFAPTPGSAALIAWCQRRRAVWQTEDRAAVARFRQLIQPWIGGSLVMAHSCPECGLSCNCGSDIDDFLFDFDEDVEACTHCDSEGVDPTNWDENCD